MNINELNYNTATTTNGYNEYNDSDDYNDYVDYDDYDGYGVFGGKDFYELVAEMNGLRPDDALPDDACRGVRAMFETAEDYTAKMRLLGIDLWHSGKPFFSPQLTEKPRKRSAGTPPQDCPNQGM